MNRPRYPFARLARFTAPLALCGLAAVPALAQFQREGGNPFKPPRATVHYARTRDYHVRHLALVLTINAPDHSAEGVVTHYLSPLRDNLATVDIDAGANLKIAEVTLNGSPVPFTHTGELLVITPPAPLAVGKEVAVAIRYSMPNANRAFGGANGAAGVHWIDHSPDDPTRVPGFWTQGETDGNHHWVPCYDYPNDKCTSEVVVTGPEAWDIIGNGIPGKVTRNAAKHTRTFTWTMKQPHSTYLLSLAGGELDIKKTTWAGVPLWYVVPKGRANLIEGSFGNTPDMLQFYSDVLGVKYPWPKYAQNAMIDFGGGMENVSATTLGAGALTDKRAGHYNMSGLNSHELAHQWFGDYITCKDWGDIWLNESFATYFETAYMEHLEGKDTYDRERDGNLRSYLDEASRYKRPISTKLYANPDVMFDSHTYPKGGLVLHMLRRMLGDKDFYRGLGHYLRENAMEPVDSHDLSKAITQETGKNVEPFFDQWIYKPGHPVLEPTITYDEAGKVVVVHIKQTQDTSDGTPIYDTPLTIGILPADGSANVVRQVVALNQADQEFRIPSDSKPGAVLIDPDHDLLKQIKTDPITDAQLSVVMRAAPSCLDRETAANRLSKLGDVDDAKVQLFTSALQTETNADNAANLIRILGDTKKESLRDLYVAQAQAKDSERRAAALTALGKLPKNDANVALVRKAALSDTEPYTVVGAALTTLGAWDAAGSLDVFKHQVASDSLRDQLAGRVVDALAKAKLDASAPLLLEATGPKHDPRVRVRAVRAIGDIAPTSDAVHTTLMTLLKEDSPRLQAAVANTLKERKDKAAVPALRDLAANGKTAELKESAKDAADEIEGK